MNPDDIAPGVVLADRYAIERELGAGGMGAVWRARDRRLDRDVAVKVMLHRSSGNAEAEARFEREARVGAYLHHPHVIGTYDFGRLGDTVYLVLQLVPGGDLRAYETRHRPVPVAHACRIGYQIADALVAAHAAGVIHRDLKPENVLLETVDPLHVRVADFGMAFREAPVDPKDGRLTLNGGFSGTPAYMAPEQVVDQQVGTGVDLYALGCVVFELLTGEPVFQGSVPALIAQHVYTPPRRLAELRPDVPSGLDELVDRLLAKLPALRPTAEAARQRLSHLLEGVEPAPLPGGGASDRERRMISQQSGMIPIELLAGAVSIGVAGTLAPEIATALAAAGFVVGGEPAVWLAIGRSASEIEALVATGAPVVVTGPRGDFAQVSEWLRLGVAEVVFEPLVPSALVNKLQRAVARARESSPSSSSSS